MGGFISNSPYEELNGESNNVDTDNGIIASIDEKVREYYQTNKERPNTLIIGAIIYKNINENYIKGLKKRSITIVVMPDGNEIMIGKTI